MIVVHEHVPAVVSAKGDLSSTRILEVEEALAAKLPSYYGGSDATPRR